MELNKIYHGGCLEVMKDFPDKSIDCVITSPPYWQLRDYGWSGQWGMEKTFQEYLEHLWQFMDESYRVLKDTGTIWVNLGDTYSSSGGAQVKQTVQKNSGFDWDNSEVQQDRKSIDYGVANKCLLLIPHRFAIGCIDRGWIMRNDVKWIKRNGMPESVTDRFTKKSEYFFFMAKQEKYYFDLDGIRDNHKQISIDRYLRGVNENKYTEGAEGQSKQGICQPRPNLKKISNGKSVFGGKKGDGQDADGIYSGKEWFPDMKGKNPGDVCLFWDNSDKDNLEIDYWDIPTQGSKDAHYASYSTKLIDKPIIAGCPVGGIILDPFCGTATTGCRAIDLQRKFIGIEGKEEYVKIGNKKLHPFQITQQLF